MVFNEACAVCDGQGWEIYQKDCTEMYGEPTYLDYARPCPICAGKMSMAEHLKRKAQIPVSCTNVLLDDIDWGQYEPGEADVSRIRKVVTSFVDKYSDWKTEGKGLYLYSRTKGSGKTFIASALANTLMERCQLRTLFVSTAELIDISKADNEYDRRTNMKSLCSCDLLVLDDVGYNKSAVTWVSDILYRVIDQRMQASRTTIITSNYSLAELNLDDRIVDRLNRMTVALHLPEQSVRSAVAERERDTLKQKLNLQ